MFVEVPCTGVLATCANQEYFCVHRGCADGAADRATAASGPPEGGPPPGPAVGGTPRAACLPRNSLRLPRSPHRVRAN